MSAVAGIAQAAIGIGESFIGGYKGHQAARYSKEAVQIEAGVYREEADLAIAQGLGDATQIRQQADRISSTARSQYAGAGVLLEGSPLLVLQEIAQTAELDALTTKTQGEIAQRRTLQTAEISRLEARAVQKQSEGNEGLFGVF